MKVIKQSKFWFMALVLSLALYPWATGVQAGSSSSMAKSSDIVDTAVAAGSFKTLATALQAGDLVTTLKGQGPFTVFAPTDAAFAKLPKGTLDALLKDKQKLRAVLTYHVVPGKVTAEEVIKLNSAKTANGKSVNIQKSKQGVMVNNAKVVKTDVMASNGVIHVIDTVLIP